MDSEFEHFVKKNALFNRKHKLLLALSGGKDSVCLFHLLLHSEYNFAVAHCNFKLRGDESDQDEAFVSQLCKKHEINCHLIQFDTKKEAKVLKKGTQETARILRYKWFNQLMSEHAYDKILTAHQLSDNTETMLINLMRSTGISGLHGIKLLSDNICRPLMFTNRDGVEAYIKRHQINFREDSSNESDDYLRNAIRHHATPPLSRIDANVDKAFFKSSREIAEFEALSEFLLNEQWNQLCKLSGNAWTISNDIFNLPTNILPLLLYFKLRQYGFNRTQTNSLADAANAQTGFKIQSNQWEIIRERFGYLLRSIVDEENIEKIIEKNNCQIILNDLTIDFQTIEFNYNLIGQSNCLFLDAGKIAYPLMLRNWRTGDKMQVLGMKGRKKISDILTDRKIPNAKRMQQLVIEDASGKLLVLLPKTVSETCKLDAQTKAVLRIHLNPATFVQPI